MADEENQPQEPEAQQPEAEAKQETPAEEAPASKPKAKDELKPKAKDEPKAKDKPKAKDGRIVGRRHLDNAKDSQSQCEDEEEIERRFRIRNALHGDAPYQEHDPEEKEDPTAKKR